jgi:hypothetical protein
MKMKQKSQTGQTGAAKATKDIRRATRKQYSAEELVKVQRESALFFPVAIKEIY